MDNSRAAHVPSQVPVNPVPPAPPAAAAQRHQWLWKPQHGWGVLQIGETVYVVREQHFQDGNGRTCFSVRLMHYDDGDRDYTLCLNRDGDLTCTCPDTFWRNRECKHVRAVRDAYADLYRQAAIDFLDGAGAELDRLLPPLPDEPIPEVLPVDQDADAALKEAQRTGDACGIVRRKEGGAA
jgi:hypothetical protein